MTKLEKNICKYVLHKKVAVVGERGREMENYTGHNSPVFRC